MADRSIRALGRLALLLRGIGAVWLGLLAVTSALSAQITHPAVSWAVIGAATAWALVCWRSRWFDDLAGRWGVLVVDLLVSGVVVLVPRALGESASFAGGYPFAALLIGLAVAGRVGVVAAAAVLTVSSLVALALAGATAASTTISNVVFFVLAAASLDVGWRLLTNQQRRAQEAEAALAVQQEREVTAAHLHDSVLQTLALVQRQADEPDRVRSLVRRQERELREWLFGEGDEADGRTSLRALLEEHAEQVQGDTGVSVRVVCTGGAGDAVVDVEQPGGAHGLVQAAREAVLNAATHAGVPHVDVFAEQQDGSLVVYVRDRGPGFDLDAVAADRQGVRGSILARMARIGGSADIRSSPGRGTEVELRL